jgi:hypothetical protein
VVVVVVVVVVYAPIRSSLLFGESSDTKCHENRRTQTHGFLCCSAWAMVASAPRRRKDKSALSTRPSSTKVKLVLHKTTGNFTRLRDYGKPGGGI